MYFAFICFVICKPEWPRGAHQEISWDDGVAGLDGVGVFDTSKLAVDACELLWAGSQWCLCMHVCLELMKLALYHFKGLSGAGLQPLPRPCEESCSGSILVFVILHFSRLDNGNHNFASLQCNHGCRSFSWPDQVTNTGTKVMIEKYVETICEVRAEHDSCGSLWTDFLWFLLPPTLSFGFLRFYRWWIRS